MGCFAALVEALHQVVVVAADFVDLSSDFLLEVGQNFSGNFQGLDLLVHLVLQERTAFQLHFLGDLDGDQGQLVPVLVVQIMLLLLLVSVLLEVCCWQVHCRHLSFVLWRFF